MQLAKHFWFWGGLFAALFLACSIARDLRTPMWTDELLTLYMSQQAGTAEIVQATMEYSDGAPPLYAMMVRAILPVVGHPAAAVRLPATLGYCATVLCLLAFCRRRLPAVYSWAAALLGVQCMPGVFHRRPRLRGCARLRRGRTALLASCR
jgi:hypothetical protein